jgi:glutamyl-tRNA reductase
MITNNTIDISGFCIAGINYKKADAETRGQFAVNPDQYEAILKSASVYNIKSLFILSTCNRTEIYGLADNPDDLIDLLCSQAKGSKNDFTRLCYVKKGIHAIEHLFNVSAGLDSQILGDYEIIGQLKKAMKFAKDRGFINCFLERLGNCVLQSSKTIKNETTLSSGSVSVSFAAVRYIKQSISNCTEKEILVIGIGKIGLNTCRNLVDYLGTTNITLINRSGDKAEELASELNLKHAPISQLNKHIESADIILVATSANKPIVLNKHLKSNKNKLVIDLSIPYNVEASVRELSNVTLVNVDELSKLQDETLHNREMEAPKAKIIIAQHLACFMEWYHMRKNAPALNAIKVKLKDMHLQQMLVNTSPANYPEFTTEERIQRIINNIAGKMRGQNQIGCQYLEAINEFIMIST